jgi:adenosine deaminase
LADLPLAPPELHLHLDGSLRPTTVRELAARLGLEVPPNLLFRPQMGLSEALERFAFTLRLLQRPAEVERVAREICEDAAAQGVQTLEVRFAPQLHAGGSLEAIVDAALAGVEGRAGLILCGLYGESPSMLDRLVEIAASRPGVVGIDLAGGPAPSHPFQMADCAPAFRRARELGIGRTVHAGEGRPPEEIRVAIQTLFAQRIGHGTTLLQDPAVLDLVLEQGIVIEACPTSNLHTGAINALADHPLPQWLAAGVRACICADNTLLSDTTTTEENARALTIPGMTPALLARAAEHGVGAAFRRA